MVLGMLIVGTALTFAVVAVAIIIAIVVVFYFIGIRSRLMAQKNDIDRSFFDIDLLLKQRHDELPKLIQTCKGYMQSEQRTLRAVIEARAVYNKATTPADKAEADNMITVALQTLFAQAERYPELRANTNFRQLQSRIRGLEERIAGQRDRYNEDVNRFNIRIAKLPEVMVARFMKLQPRSPFQVGSHRKSA